MPGVGIRLDRFMCGWGLPFGQPDTSGINAFYNPQASHWSWSSMFRNRRKISIQSVWFVVEETTGLILFVVCTSIFARKFW